MPRPTSSTLARPVPAGTQVVVGLSLSAEPGLEITTQKITFSTAEMFRPVSLGCADKRVPVSPDGMTYTAEDVLSCKTESEAAPTESRHHHAAIRREQAEHASDQRRCCRSSGILWHDNTDQAASSDTGSSGDTDTADNTDAEWPTTDSSMPTDGGVKPEVDGGAADGKLATTSVENPANGPTPPPSSAAPSLVAKRELVVQFSTPLAEMDTVAARNLVRISPAITQREDDGRRRSAAHQWPLRRRHAVPASPSTRRRSRTRWDASW